MPLGMETADWFMREAQRRLSSGDWLPFARVDPNEPEDPNPTWNKQIARSVGDTISDDPGTAREIANQIGVPLEMLLGEVPYVGQGLAADEVKHSYDQGDWLGVGLNALDMLPGGGALAKAVGAAAPAVGWFRRGADEVAGEGPTVWHEISKQKLKRPIDEMTATYGPQREMKERVELQPQDLLGGTLIPLVGDRTIAGRELTHINDKPLSSAVNLQGGPNFMRDNPDVWASEKGALSKIANRAAETENPLLIYSSMSGRSGDYSRMMTDAILAQMADAPVTKKSASAFDSAMRAKAPDFPGIRKVTPDWVANAGDDRTKMAQLMALDQFQQMGFPDVASTRWAITEPELLNLPSGASGMTVARPGGGVVTDPAVPHPTYNTNLPGDYLGGLPTSIPREVMFPDWAKTRPPGESRSTADRSMLMGDVRQKADEQWLEGVMRYLEGLQRGR